MVSCGAIPLHTCIEETLRVTAPGTVKLRISKDVVVCLLKLDRRLVVSVLDACDHSLEWEHAAWETTMWDVGVFNYRATDV